MNAFAAQAWPIIRNDLRLTWRQLQGGHSAWRRYGALLVLFLITHGPVTFIFFGLKRPPPAGGETLAWLFFVGLMTSAAVSAAVTLLFERSDFDLLLSSPVPFQAVLFARLVSISLVAMMSVALFALPIIDSAILMLSPRYVAAFVVWILLAGIAGALGTSLTLALVRSLGPKRARLVAQVAIMLLGASVGLIGVLPALLGKANFKVFVQHTARLVQEPWFASVGRANRGAPLELIALAAVTLLALGFTARTMAHTFVTTAQGASIADAPRRRSRSAHRWTAGFERAAWRKEIRLMLRSPKFLPQILVSGIAFLVITIAVSRTGGAQLIAPMALFLGSQLAMILGEVVASSESCWDLIRISPAHASRLWRTKMIACLAVPLVIAGMLCLALGAMGRPWVALVAFASTAACAAGCAWVALIATPPAPRQDVMQTNTTPKLDARIFVTLFLLSTGAGGVGLIAFGFYAWGACGVGLMALGVLACFTLIEPRGMEEQPA